MDLVSWIASGVFLLVTGWLWVRTMALYHSYRQAGRRETRRLSQRMIFAVGVWQVCLAAFMVIAVPDAMWSSSMSLGMCGLALMGMSAFWRRVGLP